MIFFLAVPAVGILCIAASVGIMTDVSRDRWFPMLLYLFVPAVSSVLYTLARFGLIFTDTEIPDPSGKMTFAQKAFAVNLTVFFISSVLILIADVPGMADEALLYTKAKNLVFEKKEIFFMNEKGEKHPVLAMIADTPEKQGIGMMAVSELKYGEGMLYIFEKEEIPKFSMSHISLELEEIVIGRDLKITEIIPTEPCVQKKCPVYKGSKSALYSVEVPKGFSEKKGIAPGMSSVLPGILFHR